MVVLDTTDRQYGPPGHTDIQIMPHYCKSQLY